MSTQAQHQLLEHADIIRRAAAKEHKDSRLFTVEDLEQEIWVALLPYAERLVNEGEGFIYRSAQKAAGRYAERERQDNMYFRGAFIYTPDMVRQELEVGAWEVDPEGDWDLRLDVLDAYEHLNTKDQDILFRRFYLGHKLPSATDRKDVARAVDKMTHYLNGLASLTPVDVERASETA